MQNKPRVAFVGEAMIELIPSRDGTSAQLSPAGDVLNSAVYFKRLCKETASARFVTVVGEDPFSEKIIETSKHEDLEVGSIRQQAGESCGLYSISTSTSGERSFSYWRSASAARTLFQSPDDFVALQDCDVVLITGITLAIMSANAREGLLNWIKDAQQARNVKLAFDSNYRPKLWENLTSARMWTERFWQATDIAFPSIDDESDLFGDADTAAVLKRFATYNVSAGALKCGTDGAYILGGPDKKVPVQPVLNVVDTTAAGDSFNGGFLSGFVAGRSSEDCVQAGQRIARHVIQHRGGIVPAAPSAEGT